MSTQEPTAQVRRCIACDTVLRNDANFCGVCGAAMAPSSSQDLYIGQIIGGRYQVKELIGQGGMGDVYLAEHEKLGQKVAIKFLPERYSGQPTIVQRFFNEARSTCRVNHPNAVSLNDFGQTPSGSLYIIMEYIDGEPLSVFVKREGPLAYDVGVNIVVQVCDALHAAHKQRVIHRDMKPDNIMLSPSRRSRYAVKVLDFGIAKLIDENEIGLTQTGTVFGTPEFMSPEQASGEPVDGRSDLYGVAMILYYLLCGGRLPFEGKDRLAILGRQVNEKPTPPSDRVPAANIPPELEAVIMKALQKSPSKRYDSVDIFADELERVVEQLRDRARHPKPKPKAGPMKTLLGFGDTIPPAKKNDKSDKSAETIPAIPSKRPNATFTATKQSPRITESSNTLSTDMFKGFDIDLSDELDDDTSPPPSLAANRNPWIVGGAVAVVLIFIVGVVIAMQASDEPETETPPVATTPVAAETTPPPKEEPPSEVEEVSPAKAVKDPPRKTRPRSKRTNRKKTAPKKKAVAKKKTTKKKDTKKTAPKKKDTPKIKVPDSKEPPKTMGSDTSKPTPPKDPPRADPPKTGEPPKKLSGEPPKKL